MNSLEPKKILVNRQAHHHYFIEDTLEAGMVLEGWEVKAILSGRANFNGGGSYVKFVNGEAFIESMTITPQPDMNLGLLSERNPSRSRKLLLTAAQLAKWSNKIRKLGYTVVPLAVIRKRKLKLEIGLARGKKLHDKRETVKQRDLSRIAGD